MTYEIPAELELHLNEREAKMMARVHKEYAIKLVQQIVFGILTLIGVAMMVKFNALLIQK